MRLFTTIIFLLFLIFQIRVQGEEIYKIPFGSKGNELELKLFNESKVNLKNINVKLISKPEWIMFENNEIRIKALAGKENYNVNFFFDVDRRARISKIDSLVFEIMSDSQSSIKKFEIVIMPPKNAELFQNYPNPFNPTTIISYQIGSSGLQTSDLYEVSLTVFDILGRELVTLVNENQNSGYYEEVFDVSSLSSNVSSGIYFYQLSIKNPDSRKFYSIKKMLLIK